jgi:SAM-dependent methyltransferase
MTDQAQRDAHTSAWRDEAVGRAWAELQEVLDRLNQPIGEIVAAAADPGPGGRVLDVGCGPGATTLDMARRVGAQGRSVGIDISAPLLEIARNKAQAEGLDQATFIQADAQTYGFEDGAFDAVMSRFGVMFFDAPEAAFANLRRATRPDGRLAFVCWRSAAENPLAEVTVQAGAPFLPDLKRPPEDAPGRFAFAKPERVRAILEHGHWKEIEIAPLDTPMPIRFDEMMRLTLELGALGPALREQSEAVRAKVRDAVAASLQAHTRDGVVEMIAACWLVTARA